MSRQNNERGMSFLEMAVSIAIFNVIMASIFTVIFTGRLYWRVGGSQLNVQQQARQAIFSMARELRQTSTSVLSLVSGPPDEVTFKVPQYDSNGVVLDANGQIDWPTDTINYSLNTDNQIIRSSGSETKVLANKVSGLLFSQSADVVEIVITTLKSIPGSGESVSYVLRSKVKLRN